MMGGYQHLFKVLLKIDPVKVNSNLAFRSINFLFILLNESMEKNQELLAEFREYSLIAIDRIIRVIHEVVNVSLEEEKKRGISYDELYYKNREYELSNARLLSYYEKSKSENDQDEQNPYYRKIHELNEKFESFRKFIILCFRLFYNFEVYNKEECIARIADYQELPDLLIKSLYKTDNFYIRDQMGDSLIDICYNSKRDLPKFIEFKKSILTVLIYKVKEVEKKNRTRTYKAHEIVSSILTTTKTEHLNLMNLNFEEIIQKNIQIIFDKDNVEKSIHDNDQILYGAFNIVRSLLQQYPKLKKKYGAILLKYLLKECLFEVPKSNRSKHHKRPPKCKNNTTRNLVFGLIIVMTRDCLENLEIVLNFLKKLQEKSNWRTRTYQDWTISHQSDEKSQTGYVGIKNLGCICYMISMLQQLYMIPSFRESVLAIEDPNKNTK